MFNRSRADNCYSPWIEFRGTGWRLRENASSFRVIAGFSEPLAARLLVLLLRAKPISTGTVAALAGLDITRIEPFLLAFNHPVEASVFDLD